MRVRDPNGTFSEAWRPHVHAAWVAWTAALLVIGWPEPGRSESTSDSSKSLPAGASSPGPALVMPTTWLPSKGRECRRQGKRRRYCQGPRRVPAPHGPDAEVATRIGLGTIKTASQLILDPAPPEWIAAAGSQVEEGLFWPVDNGRLWRGMDRVGRKARLARRGRTRHKGIDIGAQEGSPIKAVKSGLVAYSDNGVRGYGNLLITLHPDGSVAFYAHCQATYVFPGQTITQGQVIAEVGDTGAARGPHLHFEYRENGRLRDPLPLFLDRPDR